MEEPRRDIHVRVSTGFDVSGVDFFTANRSMRVGRCVFHFNPPDGDLCDFWIVFGNPRHGEMAKVGPNNTLLIVGEPPAKKKYPTRYYRQFSHVIDTHGGSKHPGLVIDALCLFWLVGLSWKDHGFIYGYDRLKSLTPPEKSNKISVVCSSTASTLGQRKRLVFLERLKERLGDQIVHYGKGFEPINDKMDAILPHRFHLVLENSQSEHYWTEKLADAYLGWAFPLYVGCPNLGDYFDPESFVTLNMDDVDGSVLIIEKMLNTTIDERELNLIAEAREKLLEVYNPFQRFSMWVERFYKEEKPETVKVYSPKSFNPLTGWFYRWRKSFS
jgi:hypothetical protein